MFITRLTAAKLLNCSADHVRKLQQDPKAGLSKIYRAQADLDRIVDQRSRATALIDVRDLARFLLLRSRATDLDLRRPQEPTEEELEGLATRLIVAARILDAGETQIQTMVSEVVDSACAAVLRSAP